MGGDMLSSFTPGGDGSTSSNGADSFISSFTDDTASSTTGTDDTSSGSDMGGMSSMGTSFNPMDSGSGS